MRTFVFIQARLGSVRLADKVTLDLAGSPMVVFLYSRLKELCQVDDVIVLIPESHSNDPLADLLDNYSVRYFRGSEADVLRRYRDAADKFGAELVIRVTADCPLLDPLIINEMLSTYSSNQVDYMSNTSPPTFPDGFDVEIFTRTVLIEADEQATDPKDREHVTPFMRRNLSLETRNFTLRRDYSWLRLTVDQQEDYDAIKIIMNQLGPDRSFKVEDVITVAVNKVDELPNQLIKRNEGAQMSNGQKLWERAKTKIAGGNMLLSKRPELHCPEQWPPYYSKANGCWVWDLDENRLLDMSLMGVGTSILGYSYEPINMAVKRAIDNSVVSSLNNYLELELAERLLDLNPWAGLVKFARTGGEANLIALRIARAASGRDRVAFCGYHGWHDWYLSANFSKSDNLDIHLFNGVGVDGIPDALADLVVPFFYNDFESFSTAVSEPDIGVIIMEVCRSEEPANGFLEFIRQEASERGIVLIFDECTSGFRETFGGVYSKYGIVPDIAVYGKALGNGHAITAIVGTENVMDYGKTNFISSTFWSEAIGPAAALATLSEMENLKSWEIISERGRLIKAKWEQISKSESVKIAIAGMSALPSFAFSHPNSNKIKTLFTQAMLEKKILATNLLYVSVAHEQPYLEQYFEHMADTFKFIKKTVWDEEEFPDQLLRGPECMNGLYRMN